MNKCNICPRECNICRNNSNGFCRAGDKLKVAHVALHFGEEPCISGTRGSGTIFFCHCNLHCAFCQNAPIRDGKIGKEISVEHLVEIFKRLEQQGAHNINLVSPTQYADKIIEALKIYKPKIPVVYNTNGYEKIETLERLRGLVDIFLTDFKYVDSTLSAKYSACKDYFSVASRAILKMRELIPADEYEKDIMMRGVIVRHLVLPNNTEDSKKVIDFLASNLPTTVLSIMSQFTPMDKAKEVGLARVLKPIEYNRVLRYAKEKMRGEIYWQEATSATSELTPKWDTETV